MTRKHLPCWMLAVTLLTSAAYGKDYQGIFFSGSGDDEYLQLLDISGRMFSPDPEYQNIAMFYMPAWNGLVEGPTWNAWWIQNSYGTTYCALPFYQEPLTTFLKNSHDLWFDQMGDGKRAGAQNWVAPDGCLCDAASPGWIYYKQGDGRIDIHDWCMEFTAAGLVMQTELLLISRDPQAIAHYLPRLERVANFIETRRDPKNNLFLAGPAGNLLAPSYAGCKKPDGTFGQAYLAGLSITYIAGLDRLIEVETLAGRADQAKLYTERRDLARKGLPLLVTDEGYFVKYIDPDGTKHGVYGEPKHGYFETVCNHDAICFRVSDDAQSARIYDKIASIPQLRKYDLIITNYPALDDMYTASESIWKFGHWVNGGHWSTCEARMIMGYYRLGKYDDARKSMQRILGYAKRFRTDNPLVDFGNDVYQPNVPINCVYDTWGVPAAMIRGLFEYIYRADGLVLLPHIPPGITRLDQHIPIRFGAKQLRLSTVGAGPVTGVQINGKPWAQFDAQSVTLPYAQTPDDARICISLGGANAIEVAAPKTPPTTTAPASDDAFWKSEWLRKTLGGNALPLRIGADSNAQNRFLGDIQKAVIYSRYLNDAEIGTLAAGTSGEIPKDPALICDWSFDNAASGMYANRAVGSLPAKIVGEVPTTQSVRGKVIRLNGAGYLEVQDAPELDLQKAFTLAAWICPKALPAGGARIIDKCTVGTSDNFTFDTHPGNSLRLITPRGTVSFDAKLAPDQWAHVAATYQSAGELCLYINGKRVAATKADTKVGEDATIDGLKTRLEHVSRFIKTLEAAGLNEGYEAAHARLAMEYLQTIQARSRLQAEGKLTKLPEPAQSAADKSYTDTLVRLSEGLGRTLDSYKDTKDPRRQRVYAIWTQTAAKK